jgi:hypothetical protein
MHGVHAEFHRVFALVQCQVIEELKVAIIAKREQSRVTDGSKLPAQ